MISGRGPAIVHGRHGVGGGVGGLHGWPWCIIQQRSVSAPAASRDQGRMGVQTLVGAVVSERVGRSGARLGPAALRLLLHSSPRASALVQSPRPATVNRSTLPIPIPAPSTSCLVARAAGKPHCWPMVSKRDLGWALLRRLDWPPPSRASSRNRHAVTQPLPPVTGTGESMTWAFAEGCSIRHASLAGRHTANGEPLARHGSKSALALHLAPACHQPCMPCRLLYVCTHASAVWAHRTQEAACPSVDPPAWVHVPPRRVTPKGPPYKWLCRVLHPGST
jgi:hypothetical protein